MKKLILIIGILTLLVCCNKEKKGIDYSLYEKMDQAPQAEKKFHPKKKAKVPFSYNQIFDPFIKRKKGRNENLTYEKGLWTNIKITVIDSLKTNINVGLRKSKKARWVQGFPVIIENTSKSRTMSLPVYRGCAKIVQEAKNKNQEWIEIERFTKEKLGNFFYKIAPQQYIYTKIPIYEGKDSTTFRVRLILEDTIFYSNSYKSSIQRWMLN